ncbi:uncharacterized protein LOC142175246 [Nicotiana tabacum]|uniref:Uncharacterized protein LOC142175246 n=1 Tax=Nicotiana tabacum TaxID=4097 RepID=A0AC58TL35_TOBAC
MRRVKSQDRLQGFDPEPERTFHRRLREARDTNNIQALVQFPVNMAEEHMVVQEVAMPIIANVTSSIMKPRITGHFELKKSMIQLLHANGQFMGLPHEDPQQHILNFLEISDTYITNGVTPDYVRLTLFPFSLLGEAKRWLKAEPANSITTWNDLARKFLVRFFPSCKTTKIRSEIVAFKQKAGESLYSAWERFKGLLRDCPHHNQTNEVLAHTFIEGLHPETKIVVDVAAGGVLELDVISALSAQISTLTNQVNQMTMVINKQQAQLVQQVQVFCQVFGERHTNDLCPVNPESVCFVEEVQSKKRKHVTFNERPPPPFPQRLQKVKDNAAYKKFLDILKQVQINIPLVDILQEVPKYAKYIKDIVINKKRLTEFETVALTEECSSRIQSKLPQKLKDSGSFTIQISIGKHTVERALCDLRVSINLMPLSVFRQLGLGEPRPTTVILQLAECSLAHPEGVIEDVLPAHYEELSMISVVKSDATSLVPYMTPIDPLERALIGDEEDNEDEMMGEFEQVLDMSCSYVHGFGKFEKLDKPVTLTPPKPSIE